MARRFLKAALGTWFYDFVVETFLLLHISAEGQRTYLRAQHSSYFRLDSHVHTNSIKSLYFRLSVPTRCAKFGQFSPCMMMTTNTLQSICGKQVFDSTIPLFRHTRKSSRSQKTLAKTIKCAFGQTLRTPRTPETRKNAKIDKSQPCAYVS